MPLIKQLNENQYVKTSTGADYNRPSGVLKDRVVIITDDQASTGKVPAGFHYYQGTNELEVYLNGQYQTKVQTLNGVEYGQYEETDDFSVTFKAGVLHAGDVVRFRITSSSYNESLYDLGWGTPSSPSTAGIGYLGVGDTQPDLSGHDVWKTSENVVTPYTITNFVGGIDAKPKTIIFSNSLVTVQSNSNILLAGGINFTGGENDLIVLYFDKYPSPVWRESSRTLYK